MKVTILLNDEETAFMKAMAKRDEMTLTKEVQTLVSCELYHWMELYEDELRQEGYLK